MAFTITSLIGYTLAEGDTIRINNNTDWDAKSPVTISSTSLSDLRVTMRGVSASDEFRLLDMEFAGRKACFGNKSAATGGGSNQIIDRDFLGIQDDYSGPLYISTMRAPIFSTWKVLTNGSWANGSNSPGYCGTVSNTDFYNITFTADTRDSLNGMAGNVFMALRTKVDYDSIMKSANGATSVTPDFVPVGILTEDTISELAGDGSGKQMTFSMTKEEGIRAFVMAYSIDYAGSGIPGGVRTVDTTNISRAMTPDISTTTLIGSEAIVLDWRMQTENDSASGTGEGYIYKADGSIISMVYLADSIEELEELAGKSVQIRTSSTPFETYAALTSDYLEGHIVDTGEGASVADELQREVNPDSEISVSEVISQSGKAYALVIPIPKSKDVRSVALVDAPSDKVLTDTFEAEDSGEEPPEEPPEESTTVVVQITTNNPARGTVEGSGEYEDGDVVEVTATPEPGYKFIGWSDGNIQATRYVTVTSDLELTAYFVPEDLKLLDKMGLIHLWSKIKSYFTGYLTSLMGVPNGLAVLGEDGKVPAEDLNVVDPTPLSEDEINEACPELEDY